MTTPSKLDEARLRELADQWDADYKIMCLLSGDFQKSGKTETARALERVMSRAALSHILSDALSAEREWSEYRIAEAYQVIGAIADAGGLFNHPDVQRALTYFSEAEPEGEILPFSLAAHEAGGEKI